VAKKKHPHPDELTNGEFTTEGGKRTYDLLYDMNRRVGRLEGTFALIIVMMGFILSKVFNAW